MQIFENTTVPLAMREEKSVSHGFQSQMRDDNLYGFGNSYIAPQPPQRIRVKHFVHAKGGQVQRSD